MTVPSNSDSHSIQRAGRLVKSWGAPRTSDVDVVMVVPPLSPPSVPHPSKVLLAGLNDVVQTAVPAGVDDFFLYRIAPGPDGTIESVAAGDDVIVFDESSARTFLTAIYEHYAGRWPRDLREDFAGNGADSVEWVLRGGRARQLVHRDQSDRDPACSVVAAVHAVGEAGDAREE